MICMQELNIDILKKNVRSLMDATNTTQPTLADAIGMSQPNMSKCLSMKNKQCFTMAQVYKIAQYFETSVDSLVGGVSSSTTGSRSIAAFIASLLEHKQIEIVKVDVEEDVKSTSKRKIFDTKTLVPYNAFFLPNYITDEETRELFDVGKVADPKLPNYKINNFLNEYISVLEMYTRGSISEESYKAFLHELLSNVPEK